MAEVLMTPLLETRDLQAGYGNKLILQGVSLAIGRGELVALFGHNGAGKSTLLRAVFGLLPTRGGAVYLAGQAVTNQAPAANVRAGIALVPQARAVFPDLLVEENLRLGRHALPADRAEEAAALGLVYDLFPDLGAARRRAAGLLSGGQQRLLSIAMALVRRPQLLLLDEPSIGLSPVMVRTVFDTLAEINARLGLTLLVAEQNVKQALRLAERVYVLKVGRVAWSGASAELGEQGRLAIANLL